MLKIITEKLKRSIPEIIRTKSVVVYYAAMVAALIVMCVFVTTAVSKNLYKSEETDLLAKANIISGTLDDREFEEEYTKGLISMSLAGTKTRGILLDGTGKAVFDTNTSAQTDGIIFTSSIITKALSGGQESKTDVSTGGIKTLSVAVPVYNSGTISGVIFLSKDMGDTDRTVGSVKAGIIIFSLVILMLMIILSIKMERMVTSPVNDFVVAAQEISKGNFENKIPVRGNSEMDQLANAMNYMCSELELLETKRRKFVSDASHELKTPMATIKLICDSITATENPDTEMVAEFLSDLSDEVDRLTRIIEKLLLLTKLDSKETQLTMELVDFGMMLERIKNKLTPIAASKNIIITTDIQADMLPVTMDHDRIWESLYNITDNAIKYSKIGSAVKIVASSDEKNLTVKIIDSGKGIPDEFKERVFERFYRLDDSRARDTGGTGLGLAIAREAVLLHKGELFVEDNPEGGSCFVMVLPLKSDLQSTQNGGDSQ